MSNIAKPPKTGGFLFCIDILDNRIGQDNKKDLMNGLDNHQTNISRSVHIQALLLPEKIY